MARSLVTWLKVGVVLELLSLAAIALLVVFDLYAAEAAMTLALKVSLGILILAGAGVLVGAVLGRRAPESPDGNRA